MKSIQWITFFTIVLVILPCCKKLVEIDPPKNTIVSEQAFSNDNNANASIIGLYSKLIDQSRTYSFGNGNISTSLGISADELAYFGSDQSSLSIYSNQILSDNGLVYRLWQDAYSVIYDANACLEQLDGNSNVTPALKNQLIGEGKFIRALCYFYLANIFGDVPYLTSTDYRMNSSFPRTSSSTIMSNILDDLNSAIDYLPGNFSPYKNERVRVTKWAALSLMARIYLYTGDWIKAANYSGMVISSNVFSLVPNLNNIFLKNSSEAIFQLSIAGNVGDNFNVTPEAAITIPLDRTSSPTFYLPQTFLSEFESGDKRRVAWVDSTIYSGVTYFIPFKYKVGPSQKVVNSSPAEYYMLFRLAEQYLIKAEADAQNGDLVNSANDLTLIRTRAGLPPLSFSSKNDALDKILKERKKELMFEWGHRWLDLKRVGKLDSVMNIVTPQKGGVWKTTAKLFPLPAFEVLGNANLVQNPGY